MKTPAFQKVSGINPAFLFPSICSTSLLSHPNIFKIQVQCKTSCLPKAKVTPGLLVLVHSLLFHNNLSTVIWNTQQMQKSFTDI